MRIFDKKKHEIGDNSNNNNQAGRDIIINNGVSFSEAKEIALDVYHANFYKLSSEVKGIVDLRAQEFIDDYIKKAIQNKTSMNEFKNPDYQYIFYKAQESYIRNGKEDLKNTLQHILLKRAEVSDFSLKQIVLNESIDIVHKLTPAQINIISILFILNNSIRLKVVNLKTLYNYLDEIFKFLDNKQITAVDSNIQHLNFLGCTTSTLMTSNLINRLKATYSGVFYKGFTKDSFENFIKDNSEFKDINLIPCINDNSKFQIDSVNIYYDFSKKFSKQSLDKLKNFQDSYLMSEYEIEKLVKENYSQYDFVMKIYNFYSSLSLTSVGIAIAIANLTQHSMEFDLDVWINEKE
ncbi:MAG: LPO_1073/Vpar_1526 family protein [Cetobacterium sp.]|uniref:LPO_1073/Vpar_1526 family protein n=1 Tax=Cetobacterium sp. TaxID=2071632 RepID=UPI003EE77F11